MLSKEETQKKFDTYFDDLLYYNKLVKEQKLHREFNKTMQTELIGMLVVLAEVLEEPKNNQRISKFLKEKLTASIVACV